MHRQLRYGPQKIELDSRASKVPLPCSHEARPLRSGRTAVNSIRGACLGPRGGDPRSVTQRPVVLAPDAVSTHVQSLECTIGLHGPMGVDAECHMGQKAESDGG